ncbi:AMP-binding protein [Heliophilum fasciatum]|uniref:Acyl-[acyl-carrier-protein]-phospholipid O-acyltransferase/long-chain-fatty-acid--[acyl-carrier-protein] ligase n=1 Tax=Heliophilum fasciatum TaxID=35700 RepID=A0A4R2S8I3_9FIRM|nr:AMP-binding protein [Heliophilum fasciatum]MCW2276808.1 acyl-[acyl-carrier-protein]-phospholipid O-acyltransferase/long-chain-fatty-acid--[acyl-carrier-protein] ligase [Heliophilum fasciatum]TCP68731.1 acyl-[acyl-carrier-protein]-phospholipid O-acyltransferase/long-chain-fatty-acid--[acyl-carrier-protein] ligase [Heliophilum fasciatum]
MKTKTSLLQWLINSLFRVEIIGLDKIKACQQAPIIMPNHVSLLDAVVLAANLPAECLFVVDTTIAQKYEAIIKMRDCITVDPTNPYSLRKAVHAVAAGRPLVLFPEGRITVTGGLMKIYDGISFIALKTGVPVIPVHVGGLLHSKLSYVGHIFPTQWFPQVTLTFGQPFYIEPGPRHSVRQAKQAASTQILRALQQITFEANRPVDANLYDEVLQAAKIYGAQAQILEDPLTKTWTYQKLLLTANGLAHPLKRAIGEEARVGILLPTSVVAVIALLALCRVQVTPAFLNFSLGSQGMAHCAQVAGLRYILTSKAFLQKANLEEVAADLCRKSGATLVFLEDLRQAVTKADKMKAATAVMMNQRVGQPGDVILFTSGSEGKPKGVVLAHDALIANVRQIQSIVDVTPKDRFFNALPVFHSFGLTAGILLPLLAGSYAYQYPTPLHYTLIPELVYDKNCTVLFGTSTFMAGYGKNAGTYDFRSVRLAIVGAEKLRDDVRHLWQERFGIRLLEGYGCTETAPVIAVNTPLAHRPGTVGPILPGMEGRIEPVEGIHQGGRLLVRGPNLMRGYLIEGQGFVPLPKHDWYDTGDIADIDEDGFIRILSRLKRFAKIGGEMVPLGTIEEAVVTAFGVASTAVAAIARSDPRKGESIVLVTTALIGRDELRSALAAAGLPPVFIPSKVIRIEKIPLLGSGKVDYGALQRVLDAGGAST